MNQDDSFFKEKIVEDYLSTLLTESEPFSGDSQKDKVSKEDAQKLALAEKLLEKASIIEQQTSSDTKASQTAVTKSLEEHKEIPVEVENKLDDKREAQVAQNLKARLDERFQALFFDVAGLTLAVPLTELGGIHQISSINHIVGKPKWFKGVMIKGEEKIKCVDSAQWVMPEKYSEKIKESIDYKYLVMLDKSPWGMMSESLINTVELQKSDVKWRQDTSKRPWLAGVVKEKMCALVDVTSFIDMLESDATKK